jgi:hypothetical protein
MTKNSQEGIITVTSSQEQRKFSLIRMHITIARYISHLELDPRAIISDKNPI